MFLAMVFKTRRDTPDTERAEVSAVAAAGVEEVADALEEG